jgi:hypothetical protein
MFKRALKLFRRSPRTGGRKANMAETTTTATPQASSGGINQEAVDASISKAMGPLLEKLDKLVNATAPITPAAAAQTANADKPLTAAELTRMLDQRDEQRSNQQKLQDGKSRFVGEKMKDLPQVYQGLLGNDPAKWAAEEQDIRTRFKADLKTAGVTAADVGGDASQGASAAGAIDLSKMNTQAKLELGLKQSTAARPPGTAAPAANAAK